MAVGSAWEYSKERVEYEWAADHGSLASSREISLYRILHSIDRRAVVLCVVLKEAGRWSIIGDGERVLKTGEASLSNSLYFVNSITE